MRAFVGRCLDLAADGVGNVLLAFFALVVLASVVVAVLSAFGR